MRKILVVEDSPAVRETLALILGREFTVETSPSLPKESSASSLEADLLILGLSPESSYVGSGWAQIAGRFRFPVLLLVDSRATPDLGRGREKVHFLAKPFNPYLLREKVREILSRSDASSVSAEASPAQERGGNPYLEFPYLGKATAILAQRFAQTRLPILLWGELGCGEERVAEAIHLAGQEGGPWVPIYLGQMGEEAIERQVAEALERQEGNLTLFLHGVDALSPLGQSLLLRLLEGGGKKKGLRLISSSRVDLLERVYRGDFLAPLYYRLAKLTLHLAPLRERRDDLPRLAGEIARAHGAEMGLGEIVFGPDALERIQNYLWFGNLGEMEGVIARTLAVHRKGRIEGAELLFGFEDESRLAPSESAPIESPEERGGDMGGPGGWTGGGRNGDMPDLRVLVHELAHELKNPMVTIKTFAQLLKERFDDAAFRDRFQDAVSHDIERMDDLLEVLLEFSRFGEPQIEELPLGAVLDRLLQEVAPEGARKELRVGLARGEGQGGLIEHIQHILADEAQIDYALKNLLLGVVGLAKPAGEVRLAVAEEGALLVSYLEGEGEGALGRYLDPLGLAHDEGIPPLRILLAKLLLKRNGGGMEIQRLGEGRVVIRINLPLSQTRSSRSV